MADDTETPMLVNAVDGAVDYRGRPASRSDSGGWRSAALIIGVEFAERFAFTGVWTNMVNYLTGPLGMSTAAAAVNVNAWSGAAALLPLLGAFVGDSFLGRYRSIVISSVFYIFGLALLTLSAILPSLIGSDCQISITNNMMPCHPPQLQFILFFFSIYIVAAAQGGHKPCTQSFGADQFDSHDPKERESKSSFFNWWYFGICSGSLATVLILTYIQDNLSWALGFGIPCIAMVISLVAFLLGTSTYRYGIAQTERDPFVRIGRVFVAAFRNWQRTPSSVAAEVESHEFLTDEGSEHFKFLNKALLAPNHLREEDYACGITEVEEAKAVLRLVPIWGTCLIYAVVFAQSLTFFTKQAATMDRTVVSSFRIPAASLNLFTNLTVLAFIPIYDRVFVPIARAFTRKPAGITMLQRIGTGIFLSTLSMVVAALVEMKRLKIVQEYDLVDKPSVTVPMSVWWLVPQYVIFGLDRGLTMVGMQEFFYDQVPPELRSVGVSLYLSIMGVGSYLSSILISAIEKATSGDGRDSWFSNNLNRAHLDYFYLLLSGLSLVGFAGYLHFTRSYIYYRRGTI
ncbi:Proton-dependent oligopeptide transporter [Parasponia andersonii]|uniref:Proton-dependent oligopeptide transporter n=1 Tax=Parasponia andersonii TaxID=3476 RepID=A0A2P5BE30_PARAD|nr:Proton-dependent oligopeptide transporter [Parasponia andersonii]